MTPNAPGWLVARPIAHRGLHDARHGVIENSLSAAKAAIAKHFAIECDVQLSGDGEAMVFHDYSLDRLTREKGPLDAHSAMTLSRYTLGASSDCIPRLSDFLAQVAQRTPVICEIKSRFDGDMRLAERTARCACEFGGPIALKSFDPAIIAHLRAHREELGIARGLARGTGRRENPRVLVCRHRRGHAGRDDRDRGLRSARGALDA